MSRYPSPDQVSQEAIASWINSICSFHNRHTKSNTIEEVARWLGHELNLLGYRNVWFHNYSMDGHQLKNVLCSTSSVQEKAVIICAHYDSIMEDINNSFERAPGANDNASGMSVVLELARILANLNLNYCVTFAFFSGEEQGLWGSTAYAKHVHEKKEKLDMLINLDMVGRPPLGSNSVIVEKDVGNVVPDNDMMSNYIGEIMLNMAKQHTKLKALSGPIYNSDYMPFEALGYHVVGIFDDGENNSNHHSKYDLPSTLNLNYIAEVAKLVLATLSYTGTNEVL